MAETFLLCLGASRVIADNATRSVTNLKSSSVNETSFTVSWSASAVGVNYSVIIENGTEIITNETITITSYTKTGLLPGITYNVTIYSVNESVSSTGTSIDVTTLPSGVSNFQVTAIWTNQMNLSWTIPSDVNVRFYTYNITIQPGDTIVSEGSYKLVTGLLPGSNYNFTIYTVANKIVKSQQFQKTTNTTLPSSVKGLMVTTKSTNSVTLVWAYSTDNNKNLYSYTVEGVGVPTKPNIKTNTTEITNLTPGTNYNFTVYAVTDNGVYSEPSDYVNATTRPSPVVGLNVFSVSDNSVTLTWTLSTDPNKESYSYTVDDGRAHKQIGIKTNTAEIKNLAAGTDYNFTVYAVTQNGVYSETSNVVNVTTLPSPVRNLEVTSVSDKSVNLMWMFSSDPNANFYSYTVDDGKEHKKVDIMVNTTVIENLIAGTDYNFTVYAVTKNGVYSKASNIVNATTQPTPVKGLNVLSVSNSSVTLTWLFSNDPNSASYTYTVKNGKINTPYIEGNRTVIGNLDAGTNYTLIVYAVTKNGIYSQSSMMVNVTTKPNMVQGVKEVRVTEISITLQWNFSQDKNNNSYTYTVECQGINLQKISNIKNNTVDVNNLLPGEEYNVTVFAVTENGIYSQSSETVHVITQPSTPRNLQGDAVSSSQLDFTWTAPGDNNAKLYDYRVTLQDQNGTKVFITTTKETHVSISDLLPGHLYIVDVFSVIKSTESVNAKLYKVTKPLSTQSLSTSDVTNTSIKLIWEIPAQPNSFSSGVRITVYLNENLILQKETTDKQFLVTNLKPGNIYSITVESFASHQVSKVRAADPIISFSTPSLIPVETVPDPVKNLKCSKMSAYQIKVNFDCPDGNFSLLNVLVNNGSRDAVTTCPNDVIISGLQPAASYKISVQTVAFQKSIITDIIFCGTDNIGVIVGSIFGILLFLLLIAVIVFFVLKSRRSKDRSDNISFNQKRFYTISKNNFKRHYENNHANSDFGFADEYQALSTVGITQSKKAAELPENKPKNRFSNVLPYDHSRVKLSIVNGIPSSDYINANYIPGYNLSKEFIASQGPLPNTTADFWRMVWEHQVNTIVMLTNCMENSRIKCEHYWPLDYTPCTYGDITVTVTSETILSEWTIRNFSVRHAVEPGVKYVRHFHFTAWPDHGVPDSTSSIIQFRNLVREHVDQRRSNGPTVVHCSAGVGRTGTLIALDYLMQQMEKEQRIGVYSFVEKMRNNRNLMVQTEAQYIFLNKCMLDLIIQPMEEHIYENQTANELVYENASAIRQHQRENA